jgi:AmiR/NasT family two-component response regulator
MARMLVVDDERIVTRDLEEDLTQMGYEVVGVASSGEEAIVKAKSLRPDLVLMDIVMPGALDGIDAATEIIAELGIPVIFLTAYADEEFLNRAKRATAYGYIVKPAQSQQLRAAIEMALHKDKEDRMVRGLMKVQSESLEQLRRENHALKDSKKKIIKLNEEL